MRLQIILLLTTLFVVSCSTNSTGPEEENKHPKAQSLAIGNLNHVFVATTEGLYYSSDNGNNWKSLNNFSSSLVSVSPSGIIFCNRNRRTGPGPFSSEETLWRSTDGGNTFLETGWVQSGYTSWIAFNNQEHIFAWKRFNGLYRSTSQGESWNRILSGGLDAKLLIAPDDIFIAKSDGVYQSNDNGDNWLKVLDLKDISGDISYSYDALAFNSEARIFAGINARHFQSDSVETGMIFRSDDNGTNWIKTAALNSDITHLAVNSENNIFAITDQNEIFSSTNNGVHWNRVSIIFPVEPIRTLIINSNDHLFIRTWDYHIYRSLNDGVTWESIWP